MNLLHRGRSQIRYHIRGMAIAASLAGLIGVLYMGKVYGWRIDDLFQAFFIGAFIGPLCLSFEIFIYEPYLRRKPSFVGFVARWLWYQGSILLSFSLFLKVFNSITLVEAYNLIAYEDKLFAGWMVAAFNFLILVNRLLGQKALWVFFTGKYNKPREESRILISFQFSNLVHKNFSSTRLHELYQRLIFDLSEAVISTGGEIYRYLSDGVIVSFEEEEITQALQCVQDYHLNLEEKSPEYRSIFDFEPALHSTIHQGSLLVGEIGDHKREIVFMGEAIQSLETIRAHRGQFQAECISTVSVEGSTSVHDSTLSAFLEDFKIYEVPLQGLDTA